MSFISYLAILIISFFFNIIPRKISLLLGRLFGMMIYHIFPIRKDVALKNIKDNFPEFNYNEYIALLKQTYIHFGMILVDFLRTKKLTKQNIKKIVNMDEKTINILNQYPGSIIMTGHLGNWEYFLPAFGLNNLKFSIVAQTIKNSYLNKFFLKIRTLKNVEIIFKEEGKEKMLLALKNKVHLGLASDQNAGHKGEVVPLLKSQISIPKGAAIFHLKTKKPIFIGYCIMNKDYTYDFELEKLNTDDIDYKKSDSVKKINRRFTISLEKMIIKYPNQYFWFHKMKNKADYNR